MDNFTVIDCWILFLFLNWWVNVRRLRYAMERLFKLLRQLEDFTRLGSSSCRVIRYWNSCNSSAVPLPM